MSLSGERYASRLESSPADRAADRRPQAGRAAPERYPNAEPGRRQPRRCASEFCVEEYVYNIIFLRYQSVVADDNSTY